MLLSRDPSLLISSQPIEELYGQWQQNSAVLPLAYGQLSAQNMPLLARQREWIATRVLLHQLLPHYAGIIQYRSNGQPYLDNGYAISISHSQHWVALALHPHQKIGIDIEELRPKIVRIAEKFLAVAELQYLQAYISSESERIFYYTVYWCAKEALFKWYGLGQVDFKKHLQIKDYDRQTGFINACVYQNDTPIELLLRCQIVAAEVLCVWVEPR